MTRPSANPDRRLGALILAAGAGSRFGGPKALATLGPRSWLRLAVEASRDAGYAPVVVVTGCEEQRVRAQYRKETPDEPIWVSNPAWRAGRTGSIQAGLRCAAFHQDAPPDGRGSDIVHDRRVGPGRPGPRGALIYPVDFPYVQRDTLVALHRAFWETSAPETGIVVPVENRRRGHPILLGRAIWPQIAALGPDEPLRVILHRDPERIREVAVPDDGIHHNINRPGDLVEGKDRGQE